jgi:hypothetical protein
VPKARRCLALPLRPKTALPPVDRPIELLLEGTHEGSMRPLLPPITRPMIIVMICEILSIAPSWIFQGMMVSLIHCPGSIIVNPSSRAHTHCRPNKFGWRRCIWTPPPPSGTTHWNENMVSCLGHASRNSSTSTLDLPSDQTFSAS